MLGEEYAVGRIPRSITVLSEVVLADLHYFYFHPSL